MSQVPAPPTTMQVDSTPPHLLTPQQPTMAAQLPHWNVSPPPRARLEFASRAVTAISVLEQRIAQLERMQLHTAQTSLEPSETDRHLHHEIAVLTAQLESRNMSHPIFESRTRKFSSLFPPLDSPQKARDKSPRKRDSTWNSLPSSKLS